MEDFNKYLTGEHYTDETEEETAEFESQADKQLSDNIGKSNEKEAINDEEIIDELKARKLERKESIL